MLMPVYTPTHNDLDNNDEIKTAVLAGFVT